MFSVETCGSQVTMARYALATGKLLATFAVPLHGTYPFIFAFGVDPSSQWLIATIGSHLWTEHDGHWAEVPRIRGGLAPQW